jgi:hypothetical protein
MSELPDNLELKDRFFDQRLITIKTKTGVGLATLGSNGEVIALVSLDSASVVQLRDRLTKSIDEDSR